MPHCTSLGSLVTPVPQVPGAATLLTPSGAKRGICVQFHGINTFSQTPIADPLTGSFLTIAQALQTDGWVTIHAIMPGDDQPNGQGTSSYNNILGDAAFGANLVNTYKLWWDHMVQWVAKTYSPAFPITLLGDSWGSMGVLLIAINRTSTITSYISHHPTSNPSLINPSVGALNWQALTSTGINTGATGLNSLGNGQQGSPPLGLLGWGTIDTIVDYPQSGDLLTPAIYSAANGAGQPVFPNCNGTGASSGGTPEGHVVSAADITVIEGFYTTHVDPICPAVF